MRIAHIVDYIQPKLGYQDTYLPLEQIKLGHIVKVFTSDRYSPFANYKKSYEKFLGKRFVGSGETVERGIEIIRLKVSFRIFSRVILKGLKKCLIDFNPDIVICHGVDTLSAYIVSRINFDCRVKVIFDDHMGGALDDSLKRRLLRFMYLLFCKKAIEKRAYKIFGITYSSIDYLRNELFFNECKVAKEPIPLGYDPEIFYFSQKERDQIRLRYNIDKDSVVGIYTGKICKNKGIEELIAAIKNLMDRYDNFKFIFIGNGEGGMIARIDSTLNRNKIIVKDFMDQNELRKYYCASDFAIWPAGSTGSQVEASACKLPIIVSSFPAVAERVSFNNGISLNRCSRLEIFKAVESLLIDEIMREKYAENALKFAQTSTWKSINNKLLAL